MHFGQGTLYKQPQHSVLYSALLNPSGTPSLMLPGSFLFQAFQSHSKVTLLYLHYSLSTELKFINVQSMLWQVGEMSLCLIGLCDIAVGRAGSMQPIIHGN